MGQGRADNGLAVRSGCAATLRIKSLAGFQPKVSYLVLRGHGVLLLSTHHGAATGAENWEAGAKPALPPQR